MRPPTPQILDFGGGFWILGSLDFGSWGRNPKSKILNPKSPKSGQKSLDFGFWGFGIFGFWGFWTLAILDFRDFGDFGFWIFGTLCSRSLCAKFGFWNLGILDFGDLGFWILDWGFWMLHKKRRLCTPNRVGGYIFIYHIYFCVRFLFHINLESCTPLPTVFRSLHGNEDTSRLIVENVVFQNINCGFFVHQNQLPHGNAQPSSVLVVFIHILRD